MEGFSYVDMFATKGIEYLLVIGFLLAFILYFRMLNKKTGAEAKAAVRTANTPLDWFHLAKEAFYHQGHSWAAPIEANTVKVGIDDFAQKFLGAPEKIHLPQIGSRVEQGKVGWNFQFGSKKIEMLSPVNGEVMEINEAALKDNAIIARAPYDEGWLMKVKVDDVKQNLNHLLSGKLAIAWMSETVKSLRQKMSGELGVVMQDGGLPVAGFARELSPEKWDEIAAEFFLTE